jgi:hypothetical protein
MTAPTRMNSSGSPGKLALFAADIRCLPPGYTRTRKLATFFRNLAACDVGEPV